MENIVKTNSGHVGGCAINETALNLTTCVGGGFRTSYSITITCSAHGGSSTFTSAITGILTTGKVGICGCSCYIPIPILSFAAELLNYSTNIVVATSRGPGRCGNCGTFSRANYRVYARTTTRILACVRNGDCSRTTRVLRNGAIGISLVGRVKSGRLGTFCSTISGRSLCRRGSSLGVICAPLRNANGVPIHGVLTGFSMAIIGRRRLPSNGFDAMEDPGPRRGSTLGLTVRGTGRVNTSVILNASPSYSEIKVTIHSRGNSCVLFANGRAKTLLIGFILSVGGSTLGGGSALMGAVIASRLNTSVTEGCNLGVSRALAKFGCVNSGVGRCRGDNRHRFIVNCRRSCNCLINARTESGSNIISTVLVYRVTT